MKKDEDIISMCKLTKHDIEDNFEQIAEIVKHPKHICRRCARVAINKEHLCKPRKIED